ncbi:TonB-dependent receptor [Suttonella sp. R2A3]|uniref:TonB-dependent receptor domain-containing protein n=1 Tax=Suttonella sp. R2A3 TaxID=2908648 RepID=UPI001F259D65|nr:TonB-dependent receptor [Suttonella sp. R2A3]UJF23642.1 TonB-dependent receptor [Suttonella sp. R2A3]
MVLGAGDNNRGAVRDAKGYNDVYALDISTTYAGFEEVQRFKGTTPADIFNGMVGVSSGDARNGGAIDPNVRGVQGEGRVPVIIDGGEQAVTVWRGYNGANNRNYIDPMLIGGLQVEKGPSLTRGVNSSVGGAVVINTIDADDIIPEGKDFAVNVMVEGSNNSVKPRLPNLVAGQNIYDIPGNDLFKMTQEELSKYNAANGTNHKPVNYGLFFGHIDPEVLKYPNANGKNKFGDDYAFRIAAAKRWENFDLMGAVVKRQRGNYFAGKNGWQAYYSDKPNAIDVSAYNTTSKLANIFGPEAEIFNTSSDTTSYLGKATWRPNNDHVFQLGLRHSTSKFGDILPTRLDYYIGSNLRHEGKLPQWTLGDAKTSASTLEWRWKPENPLIDLNAKLWGTYNDLNTNTSGSEPRTAYTIPAGIYEPRRKYLNPFCENFPPATIENNPQLIAGCKGQWAYFKWLQKNGAGMLSAEQKAALDKYLSYEDQIKLINTTQTGTSITNSKETRLGLNLSNKFQLNKRLDLTVGASYQYERLRSDDNWWSGGRLNGYNTAAEEFAKAMGGGAGSGQNIRITNAYVRTHPREGTRHYVEANAKFDWRPTNWAELSAGLRFNYYNAFDDHIARMKKEGVDTFASFNDPKKWHNSGWAPMLSGAVWLSDSTRVYARMAQAVRHPSLFESTWGFSGFTTSTKYDIQQLKSERSTNYEIGIVQEITPFLPNARYADVKLSWYHNTIKNVFERDESFNFTNMDKQINSGIELQARYDSGKFFADLSGSYALKNQVCDAKSAALNRGIDWAITDLHGDCADGGFPNGYLQNTVPPKYTWGLGLGTRLFDEKLTIGARINHHSKPRHNTEFRSNFNSPLFWSSATITDAYIQYKGKDWSTELTATNLTDEYYLDQYNRTMVPAPGRTIKLNFNKTF